MIVDLNYVLDEIVTGTNCRGWRMGDVMYSVMSCVKRRYPRVPRSSAGSALAAPDPFAHGNSPGELRTLPAHYNEP